MPIENSQMLEGLTPRLILNAWKYNRWCPDVIWYHHGPVYYTELLKTNNDTWTIEDIRKM